MRTGFLYLHRMSYRLKKTVSKAIKEKANNQNIIEILHEEYGSVTYPSISVYKTLLLCEAVQENNTSLLQYAISQGFDVNYKYGYASPLPAVIAVKQQKYGALAILIEHNASLTLEGSSNAGSYGSHCSSAVEATATADDLQALKLIVKAYSPDVLLQIMCKHGALSCARELLTSPNIDVNAMSLKIRHTPLMLSIMSRKLNLVEMLLNAGADPNLKTKDSETALHIAVSLYLKNTHLMRDITNLLLQHGVDTSAVNAQRLTPLSLLTGKILETAPNDECLDFFRFLAERTAPRTSGWQPLDELFTKLSVCLQRGVKSDMDGCLSRATEMLKYLIQKGFTFSSPRVVNAQHAAEGEVISGMLTGIIGCFNQSPHNRRSMCTHFRYLLFIAVCSGFRLRNVRTYLRAMTSKDPQLEFFNVTKYYLQSISFADHRLFLEDAASSQLPPQVECHISKLKLRTLQESSRLAILSSIPSEKQMLGVEELPLPNQMIDFIKFGCLTALV